jgi:hypothetical protein
MGVGQRTHRANEVGEVDVGFAAGADEHILGVVGHPDDFVGDNLEGVMLLLLLLLLQIDDANSGCAGLRATWPMDRMRSWPPLTTNLFSCAGHGSFTRPYPPHHAERNQYSAVSALPG